MENLFLIVGLGNPGGEYAKTRHNAGFLVAERLAARARAAWKLEDRFSAKLARVEFEGQRLILCEPQTFMNASGGAVVSLRDYFKIALERVLVVVDDADLPVGEIRLRTGGSSGGHHGLESVEQHFATREYLRLRIGIGRREGAREITGHVLGRFAPEELGLLGKILDRAVSQIECWITSGPGKAMSQFNGAIELPLANESD